VMHESVPEENNAQIEGIAHLSKHDYETVKCGPILNRTVLQGLKNDRSKTAINSSLIIKLRGFSPQSELYRPCDRCLSAKLVPSLADRGCRVVSPTNPHGR
jgi:hypothetical protein